MKKYFELWYWGLMTLVMSLMFTDVMGSFGAAFFLSVMLLPGVLLVKYLIGDISYKNLRRGILHTVYFIGIALLTQYLAIMFVYVTLYGSREPANIELIVNPVFIWFLLASLLSIEWVLRTKLFTPAGREKFVTFVSERVKVSIEIDSIMYIESRDYEVCVMTAGGKGYPTRMKISQWESVLDDRFIRVHRAFIVNRGHISRFDPRTVDVGGEAIEISRKYREAVMEKLGPPA